MRKSWVPLLAVAAVILGGVAVVRLRGVFGSDANFSATDSTSTAAARVHPTPE